MLRYEARIRTELRQSHVFADLCHFERAAEWDPGVVEGVRLTSEPVGLGSRFELRARFLGRTVPLEYEVVEFEQNTRIVLRADASFARSTDTISFAPASSVGPEAASGESATWVTYDARLEPKGAARLAHPLLAVAFRRIGRRAELGLRRRLEAQDQ